MLEAIGITKAFGALVVADDVHLAVGGGAREAVIGPNGAGKTTLFNILGGQLKADAGAVRLDGREIATMLRDIGHRLAQWKVPFIPASVAKGEPIMPRASAQ